MLMMNGVSSGSIPTDGLVESWETLQDFRWEGGQVLVFSLKSRALILAFVLLGCEESLPLRVEPEKVVVSSMNINSETYFFKGPWPPWSRGKTYDVGSPLLIAFTIKNVYDDVLQDSLYVRGSFTLGIASAGDNREVTMEFTNGIVYPPTQNGLLTIEPGDSATVTTTWDHYIREGEPVWFEEWFEKRMHFVGKDPIEECWTASTETMPFVGSGSIQVFKYVQPQEVGPVTFALVYKLCPFPWGP